MIPDFAGKEIIIAKIDFGLHMWTADNWSILLAGTVLVSRIDQSLAEIDVDVPETPLPPELDGLVGSTITQLLVSEDGDLAVHLGDRQISVRADPNYESWEIAGRDGERLICLPGGELTHISPVPPERYPTTNP